MSFGTKHTVLRVERRHSRLYEVDFLTVFALIVSTIYSSSKALSYLRPLCFDGSLKYTDHGLFYYQVFFCP